MSSPTQTIGIKTVVVHGATGQQGGSVVRALSAAGFTVRAAVRDPHAPRAQALAALPGVQLVRIDLEDAQSLTEAYKGADGVYAVTVPGPSEQAHGRAMADAALSAGIKLHVFSALQSLSKLTNGEYTANNFDDKAFVVEHIQAIGLPSAFLYLGAFMENYVNITGYASVDPQDGSVVLRYGSAVTHKRLPLVWTTRDAGAAAGLIFAHPDAFLGQHVGLGNVALSTADQARVVEHVTGRKARAEQGPPVPTHFPFAAAANNMYAFGADDRWDGMFTGMAVPNPLLEKYGFKAARFDDFVREVLAPHLKL
ncbi:NAD(P)-binding protein [Auricularia subglabra TFB-10046 SS5]|nr:NAD(P)-binding protein [Auricularia subglabra TFB-10046 SS5]